MVDQRARGGHRRRLPVPLLGLLVAGLLSGGPAVLGQPAEAAPLVDRLGLAAESHPASPTEESRPASLADAIARIDGMSQSGASGAEYGVAVLDRSTGRLTVGAEGAVAFYSASVVKLFTVVDILHRMQTGDATLTADQRTQIRRALRLSDNQAMTALWNAFGGPRTLTELVPLAGLRDTRPPAQPAEWGETALSPRDVTAVYRYALTALAPANRDLLLTSLATPGTISSGGFDQSYGVLRRPGLSGAVGKQGWMVDRGNLYLHTSGAVGQDHRYVIVVLSKQPASVGYPLARQRIDSAVSGIAAALGLAPDQDSGNPSY
jgi:hypothetical protein